MTACITAQFFRLFKGTMALSTVGLRAAASCCAQVILNSATVACISVAPNNFDKRELTIPEDFPIPYSDKPYHVC